MNHRTPSGLVGVMKPCRPHSKPAAYGMVVLAYLAGSSSMLALLVFLFAGPMDLFSLGLSESAALMMNGCLCLTFFVQHSTMIRKSFRRWLAKFMNEEFHGALYTIMSGFVLLGLIFFWQKSGLLVWETKGLPRWIVRLFFFLSLGGFYWGIRALGSFDAFGITPILRRLRGRKTTSSMSLTVRGPYRWVRHPLYFFCIILIWACPDITPDRLLFNTMWTGWIILGTLLEEEDLRSNFGDAYRDYQEKVPMLIPYRIPKAIRWEEESKGI